MISAQRIRLVSPQAFGILFGLIDEAPAFGFRIVGGFAERGALLLIDCFVFIFKIGILDSGLPTPVRKPFIGKKDIGRETWRNINTPMLNQFEGIRRWGRELSLGPVV